MTGEPAGKGAPSGVDAFTRVWGRALHCAAYVPLVPAERDRIVAALAEQLSEQLSAEPYDADRIAVAGGLVGAHLVACGFANPEVLARTVTLMYTRLAGDLGLGPAARAHVPALVEAVTAGFVGAVRDHTLDAQDSVRLAAMSAQARAECALHATEARFREFATHDPLTGLPNRTLFTERLTERLARAEPGSRLAVCCIDLDGFAAVNDSLGHQVGDRLLRGVADRLRWQAALSGHLVARFDSDQFVLLVEETTCAEDGIKAADLALSALAEPFHLDAAELPLTASAGIVERPAAGGDPVELVRAAQIALHWAKADGRARWRLFEPARSAHDATRYRLSAAMPAALRRGEFTLFYQPLVDLAAGRLVGVEALVRWCHPDRGLLDAGEFIGLAEDTGLIVPLGAQLLAQGCRQAAAWQDLAGDPPYISVNLAPRELTHPGVVACVVEVLDRTGLAPDRLQFELTERAVIDVAGGVTRTLSALADLGVRIAIDDFGVGYSNLNCLRHLPVHRLKLDRTFTMRGRRADRRRGYGRHDESRHDEFLAATVSLGHTLGLAVTAEGIETADQARRMRAAGCDTGQGWYFGRPVPADELTHAIASARRRLD